MSIADLKLQVLTTETGGTGSIQDLEFLFWTQSLAANGALSNPMKATDGTALLPSITFANDLNTGFYSSAPDEISYTIGGVNAGTISSALFKSNINMEVAQASSPTFIARRTAGSSPVGFFKFTGSDDSITWDMNVGQVAADLFGIRRNSTTLMAINNAGNMGINETDPDYKLDVNGTFGFTPGASVTPVDNGDVIFEFTNNTTLTIRARGTDGVVRSGTVTLA